MQPRLPRYGLSLQRARATRYLARSGSTAPRGDCQKSSLKTEERNDVRVRAIALTSVSVIAQMYLHLSSLSFLLVYPRPQFNEIDASRRRSVRPVPLNQLIESLM